MTDAEEQAYCTGRASAFRSLLGGCIRELGQEERDVHGWRLERADTVAALRELCRDYGDNDWQDNLHLGDVINKHLVPYLDELVDDDREPDQ